jgi:hypothetical protein
VIENPVIVWQSDWSDVVHAEALAALRALGPQTEETVGA